MGDTGSMFFGGIVTALAFVMQRPEMVLFFGIVYIWDAMTVVIQRTYFKATHGKRIFRMTPIHHAFEMRGWREVKIADCGHRCGNGNFLHLCGISSGAGPTRPLPVSAPKGGDRP